MSDINLSSNFYCTAFSKLGILWLIAFLLSVACFLSLPVHFDTFSGDDLTIWQLQKKGEVSANLHEALTETTVEKYRPVASLLYLVTFNLFRDNFRAYILTNLVLFTLVSAIIAFLATKAFQSNFGVAVGLVSLISTSRFSYYYVVERLGIMEISALLGAFLSAYFAVQYFRGKKDSYAWLSIFSLAFSIYSHERYCVMAPFIACVFLSTDHVDTRIRLKFSSLAIGLLASNFIIKEYILKSHFMTGTGGTHIHLGTASVLTFLSTGIANILGFNLGPAYLTGFDVRTMGWPAKLPLMGILSGIIIVGALYVKRRPGFKPALLFVILLGGLLAAASITIRQEFRWLYAPEIVLFCAVLGSVQDVGTTLAYRWIAGAALWAIFLGVVTLNLMMRVHAMNIHFMGWYTDAESTREVIVKGFGKLLSERPIYAVGSVMNMGVISAYTGKTDFHIIPISFESLDSLSNSERRKGLFFTQEGGRWRVLVLPESSAVGFLIPSNEVSETDLELIPELNEFISQSETNWYACLRVGQLLMPKNPTKAEFYLRHSIKLVGEGNPYPYFSLGQLYQSKGNLEEAEKYYLLAIQFDDKIHPNPNLKTGAAALQKEIDAINAKR